MRRFLGAIVGIMTACSAELSLGTRAGGIIEPVTCYPELPAPIAEVVNLDPMRVTVRVTNASEFPAAMFESNGEESCPSRTWVRVASVSGLPAKWFCALAGPEDLDSVWLGFADDHHVQAVDVTVWDRGCDLEYRSPPLPLP
jgi:hypothetical protein